MRRINIPIAIKDPDKVIGNMDRVESWVHIGGDYEGMPLGHLDVVLDLDTDEELGHWLSTLMLRITNDQDTY